MSVLLNGYESADWLRSIAEQHPDITRELLAVARHLDWLEQFMEKERVRFTEVQARYLEQMAEGHAREQRLRNQLADLTNPGWRTPEPIKGDM